MGDSKFKALWDFVLLSGGEMIGKVAGLLAFAYLARVLSPTAYGSVEVALAMLGIFTLFVEFGFGAIGAREISHNPDSVNAYAKQIPGMKLLLAFICIPAMCAVAYLTGNSPDTVQLIYITSFALLATVWNQNWLFQGLEKMSLVSLNQVCKMVFFAVCVSIFVRSADDLARVGIIEVGAGAVMALFFLYLQRREGIHIGMTFSVTRSRSLFIKAFAVGSSNMVWALNQYLPTLLVAYFVGGSATAWLGAAHRIVNAVISFSMVYHFNLFPAVSRRLDESEEAFRDIVYPSFRVTAWGGIAVALVVTLLSEFICTVVFGKEFSGAALPMAILIWSLPLTLLNGHARWALIAKDKQRYVLYAQAAGTLTTIIGCVLLVPDYGPAGASVAMVSCSAVVWLVAHLNAVRRVAPIPSISLVWRPLALALITIIIVQWGTDGSLLAIITAIVGFILVAPLLDMTLLKDIHRIASIKHVDIKD